MERIPTAQPRLAEFAAAAAKRMRSFTPYVYGCNRTKKESVFFDSLYPLKELPDIVHDMDIIIITIALTKETEHLIDKNIMRKLKDDCIIVNVSRGKVVDEQALIDELKCGSLGGAILDVFENEPLPCDSLLWEMENVVITPHNSFVSDLNEERLLKNVIDNFTRWEKGNGQ